MPPNEVAQRRLMRWVYQAAARELLPRGRVSICFRLVVPTKNPKLAHSPSVMKAHYKNLCICGSVWSCPICAAKISERRRIELTQAIANRPDLNVSLVTLTLRHERDDDLPIILDALLSSYRFLKTGRKWQTFEDHFGLVGSIRSLETTYGRNGFHPHLHCLYFTNGAQNKASLKARLETWFDEYWPKALGRAGRSAIPGVGADVRNTYGDIASYVQKYGVEPTGNTWGVEHEIAKSPVKKSSRGGDSPSELLANYALQCDSQNTGLMWETCGQRWKDYANCFKGRQQLVWSPKARKEKDGKPRVAGLRELLGVDDEKTDLELAKAFTTDAVILYELTSEEWRTVLANDARGELLEIAHAGDVRAIESFLQGLGIGTDKAVIEAHLDTNEDFARQYYARADRKFIREPGQAVSVDLPPEPVKPFGRRGPVPGRQREIAGEKCGVVRAFALADLGGGQ